MGGGAAIASACDYRFMDPNGKFGMAFVNMGLSCDSGSMYSLSRVIGCSRAVELIMSGEIVKADRAEKLGWARLTECGQAARGNLRIRAYAVQTPRSGFSQGQADGKRHLLGRF